MDKLVKSKLKIIESKNNETTFSIEPLERGFGHTIGNSLRRVILSYLPGYAITSVQIDGIKHEFANIEGVVEGMVDFILNLKKVRLSFPGDEAHLTLKLKKGQIKASDIKGADIKNKDFVLLNVSEDLGKVVHLEAKKGIGYKSDLENKEKDVDGKIYIDSLFYPVLNCSYEINNIRVGEKSGYDQLLIKILTDGTITGQEALISAVDILENQFKFIKESSEVQVNNDLFQEVEKEEIITTNEVDLSDLGLKTRSYNSLKTQGINTIEDLKKLSLTDLEKIPNLGSKSIKEILELLKEKNIQLKGE